MRTDGQTDIAMLIVALTLLYTGFNVSKWTYLHWLVATVNASKLNVNSHAMLVLAVNLLGL